VEYLCKHTTKKTLFCGEFLPAVTEQITSLLKSKAVIPPQIPDFKRASFLMELGKQRLDAGDIDNSVTLQPIYLRRPPIGAPKKE
jgi:hypothetical protein